MPRSSLADPGPATRPRTNPTILCAATNLAVGWDQSLNHGGVVGLDQDGAVAWVSYCAERRTDVRDEGGDALPVALSSRNKGLDPDRRSMGRLLWVAAWLSRTLARILKGIAPEAELGFAVEDYAMAAGYRAHQIGEVGGCLRMLVCRAEVPFRLHDPGSVKLFATGRGDADKEDVGRAVVDRWGVDFRPYGEKVGEDLFDAYVLARMLLTEVRVRAGTLFLRDLTDAERRVFLRVTRARPVNLADRSWSSD